MKDRKYKVRIQAVLVDLPAKAALFQTHQYNGQFGCLVCYNPGVSKDRKRIYPSTEVLKIKVLITRKMLYFKFQLRTDAEFRKCSNLAEKNGQMIFGIKRVSILDGLIGIPSQVPFDYMHLVLIGHCKWLLEQMLKSSKKFMRFSNYFVFLS